MLDVSSGHSKVLENRHSGLKIQKDFQEEYPNGISKEQ